MWRGLTARCWRSFREADAACSSLTNRYAIGPYILTDNFNSAKELQR